MSKLGQLLSYLERPDVTELIFRTGARAVMRAGNRQHPITVTPLRMPNIRRFFEGTPVLELLPGGGALATANHRLELQGRAYQVSIRGNDTAVEISVSLDADAVSPAQARPVGKRSARHPDAPEHRPAPVAIEAPGVVTRRERETGKTRSVPVTSSGLPVALPSGGGHGPARRRDETSRDYPALPLDQDRGLEPEQRPSFQIERSGEFPPSRDDAAPLAPGPAAFALSIERGGRDPEPVSPPEPDHTVARVPAPTVSNPSAMPSLRRDEGSDAGVSAAPDPTPSTLQARARADTPPALDPRSASSGRARARQDSGPYRSGRRTPSRATPGPRDPSGRRVRPRRSSASYRVAPPTEDAVPQPRLERAAPVPQRSPTRSNTAAFPSLTPQRSDDAPDPAEPSLSGPQVASKLGSPIPIGLRQILTMARRQAVSDVHIMSNDPVRLRQAGALEPTGSPISGPDLVAMIEPLLHPRHADQLRARGYADLGFELEGAGRLRVNVTRQRGGLKLCVRLVATEPPTLEALGLPPEVRTITAHHQGLVLISGPNGHGKTTTMAALVDLFNQDKPLHIITVEDPVEVIHPRKQALVTQREVGTHTRSFSTALAAALREDPDVIAIGELRDRETVEMALSAAETGHLVLATMSTPSGAKTIDRVIDMFPPDEQSQVRATLAGALKLVISQRLVRRADGRGQLAAYEVITGNVPLWSLIRDNKLFQLPSLLQRGRAYGMLRLDDSLRELLRQGLVTPQEARRHAEDPRALAAAPETPPGTPGPTTPARSHRGR